MLQTALSGASRRETQISVHKKQEVIQDWLLLNSCICLQLMLSDPLPLCAGFDGESDWDRQAGTPLV